MDDFNDYGNMLMINSWIIVQYTEKYYIFIDDYSSVNGIYEQLGMMRVYYSGLQWIIVIWM